jgi:ketosteroid isomerase-like protein
MTPTETAIHAYFAAIRRLDSEAWVACFAPDAQVRDPADSAPRIGKQAHRTFFEGIASLFRELDFRPK